MEIKIDESNINKRLDTLFSKFSRSKIASAIEEGIIKVNQKMLSKCRKKEKNS